MTDFDPYPDPQLPAPPPERVRPGRGLRFLGALLLLSSAGFVSCRSLFHF